MEEEMMCNRHVTNVFFHTEVLRSSVNISSFRGTPHSSVGVHGTDKRVLKAPDQHGNHVIWETKFLVEAISWWCQGPPPPFFYNQ